MLRRNVVEREREKSVAFHRVAAGAVQEAHLGVDQLPLHPQVAQALIVEAHHQVAVPVGHVHAQHHPPPPLLLQQDLHLFLLVAVHLFVTERKNQHRRHLQGEENAVLHHVQQKFMWADSLEMSLESMYLKSLALMAL